MLRRGQPLTQHLHDRHAIELQQSVSMQPEPWKDVRSEDPVGAWRYLLIGPILQDEPLDNLLAQDHHHVFPHARLLIIAAFGMQINGGAAGGHFHNQLWWARRIVVLGKASLSSSGRLNDQ